VPIETRTQSRVRCDCCSECAAGGFWFDSAPLAANQAFDRYGFQRVETATGTKILCKICAAKRDLPKLEADFLAGGPTADAVARGLAKDLAKERP